MKKTIIITGANGFIGRHVLNELAGREDQVYALTSSHENKINTKNITWISVDLLNENELREMFSLINSPTHLLHLAWDTTPGQYWNSASNLKWLKASMSLFDMFCSAGGERIVGIGSCAEYDLKWGICREFDTPPAYNSIYGSSKNSLHHILMSYQQSYGISCAWARVFYLYGPWEHELRLVPSVILSLLKGDQAKCSHGQQIRDYLYVKDAAKALVKLLDTQIEGPVNVGSGEPIRLLEIVYTIADILGRKELIHLNAIPAPKDEPGIVLADVERLKQDVGWNETVTLEKGLYETIEWWRLYLYGGRPSEQ
ncbi:NAD-dependent epimerase/dehydratase family protein [Paenibacillus pedocola]|uniref:NAD-dependent epimerase/dehydratase family protein n=1 Tax=Paenibacillus pedocola TaxID=3242193 RepID=UPI0028773592|nr:NAD(P)-dependent oxidoreductase [Paenibacillus typhae]